MVFESEKSGKLGEMILKYSSSADKICPTLVSSARARWIRTSFSCLREHAGARARYEVSRERKGDEDECSSNVDYTLLTRRIHIQHSHRAHTVIGLARVQILVMYLFTTPILVARHTTALFCLAWRAHTDFWFCALTTRKHVFSRFSLLCRVLMQREKRIRFSLSRVGGMPSSSMDFGESIRTECTSLQCCFFSCSRVKPTDDE